MKTPTQEQLDLPDFDGWDRTITYIRCRGDEDMWGLRDARRKEEESFRKVVEFASALEKEIEGELYLMPSSTAAAIEEILEGDWPEMNPMWCRNHGRDLMEMVNDDLCPPEEGAPEGEIFTEAARPLAAALARELLRREKALHRLHSMESAALQRAVAM